MTNLRTDTVGQGTFFSVKYLHSCDGHRPPSAPVCSECFRTGTWESALCNGDVFQAVFAAVHIAVQQRLSLVPAPTPWKKFSSPPAGIETALFGSLMSYRSQYLLQQLPSRVYGSFMVLPSPDAVCQSGVILIISSMSWQQNWHHFYQVN